MPDINSNYATVKNSNSENSEDLKSVSFDQEQCNQIVDNYRKDLDSNPDLSDKLADKLAKNLSRNGNLLSAIYVYGNIVAKNLNSSNDCNYYLGKVIAEISLRTGQFQKSIDFFEDMVGLQPNNSWLHYYLALSLANANHVDLAIEKYLHIVKDNKYFFPGYVQLGILYFKKDDLEKAIRYNIEALNLLDCYSIYDRRLVEDLAISNQDLLNKGLSQKRKPSTQFLEKMRISIENAIAEPSGLSLNTIASLYYDLNKILKNQGKYQEAIKYNLKASLYKAKIIKPHVYEDKESLVNFKSPSFLIIGVKKCATTSLYDYLMQHPQMLPASVKEPQFITQLIRQRKKDKVELFQQLSELDLQSYLSLFPPHPEGTYFTGEASTTYMWYPGVEKVVFSSFPNIKLIILLRNPVKRVISEYNFQVNLGRENRSLNEMIDSQIEYLENLSEISEILLNPRFDEYLVHSLYVYFIQKWLKLFPREQILVLRNEDLSSNKNLVMNKAFKFLNLSTDNSIKSSQKLKGYYPSADQKNISRLTSFFQPHNQKLEQLLNMDLNWD